MVNDWKSIFDTEIAKQYFIDLTHHVAQERKEHIVHPAVEDVFRAFTLTTLESTKVLILGQDPYHGEHQADGLAFSVQPNVALPPSLRNIMKERQDDLGIPVPHHGDLTKWATQGVLLLNTTLTVRHKEPTSHHGCGWEIFTDRIIELVNEKTTRVVFVLWGNSAQQKTRLITSPHHVVITSPHPSPLSAHRGFFGSRPFSRINAALVESGMTPIDWENE